MQKHMHNIFLDCERPEYFWQFSVVCWAGPTGREFPNIFQYLGGSKNSRDRNIHYMFGIFRPLQINHVCAHFRPHGKLLISARPLREQTCSPRVSNLSTPCYGDFVCGSQWPKQGSRGNTHIYICVYIYIYISLSFSLSRRRHRRQTPRNSSSPKQRNV